MDAAISLDSQHSGLVELFCEAPGNRTGPFMDFRGREIAMSTVGPNVVVDGNEVLHMAADRVDVGKVGEIERLILDGLVG